MIIYNKTNNNYLHCTGPSRNWDLLEQVVFNVHAYLLHYYICSIRDEICVQKKVISCFTLYNWLTYTQGPPFLSLSTSQSDSMSSTWISVQEKENMTTNLMQMMLHIMTSYLTHSAEQLSSSHVIPHSQLKDLATALVTWYPDIDDIEQRCGPPRRDAIWWFFHFITGSLLKNISSKLSEGKVMLTSKSLWIGMWGFAAGARDWEEAG